MPHHPVRSRLAGLGMTREEKAVIRQVSSIQGALYVERACDAASRDLIAGRMSDTAILTHYAMDEGIGIAARVEAEAHARRPLAAAVAAQIGATGVQQLERHLRSYGDR
jgi:hypothetical protein